MEFMDVGTLCTREVLIVERDESVLLAAQLMRMHNVGDVVVVETTARGRVPVGILTDRDVTVGVVAASRDPETTPVGDVLVAELVTSREDEDLFDVLARMRVRAVRRVIVVGRAGELQGVLSFDDVLEQVAHLLGDLAVLVGRQRPWRAPEERRPDDERGGDALLP